MTDFTAVKKYLLDINYLPNINDLIRNSEWGSFIEELNLVGNNLNALTSFIKVNRIKIFNILFSSPSGISLSIKENRRLIILIVQILDELEFYKDGEFWREYLEFRYKAFSLFLNHDHDAEAAKLYKDLDDLISGSNDNSVVKNKLKNQKKIYKRKISRKLKELETRKQFDKTNLLNTIYCLRPDYEYEQRVEEHERRNLKWHFLDPLFELVVAVIVTLLIYGINLMVIKKDENHDIFAFFAKGNFDFYELLFGFALIFLMFWLFKLIDHQPIKTLWRNISKGALIFGAMLIIYGYVTNRYENEFERYFPGKNNNEVARGDYNDGKTRVLVTKFMPLEKTTIFNKDYSDVNISQLFYKKMVAQTIDDNGKLDDSMLIDYYPDNFSIYKREDMQRIYDQGKYDVIISGDFIKEKENDIKIFTSLHVVDNAFLEVIKGFKKNYSKQTFCEKRVNSSQIKPLNDFLTYFDSPLAYYDSLLIINNSQSKYSADFQAPCGLEFDVNKDFSPEFSLISTIEKSPIICINYIKILNTQKKKFNSLSIDDCDNVIKWIDDIILWNNNIKEKNAKQLNLQIYMLQLKIFFINQRIILNKNRFKNWILKIENYNKCIESLCKLNDIDSFKTESFLIANTFFNYLYLSKIKNYKNDPNTSFFKEIKPVFHERLIDLEKDIIQIEKDIIYKSLYENDTINNPFHLIKQDIKTIKSFNQ